MEINSIFLDNLSLQAKNNPRLRQSADMRTTSNDNSQRILNALEPGTIVPIHRHLESSETVAVLRGSVRQTYYDDSGNITNSVVVESCSSCPFYMVEKAQWHKTECLEPGTIIFESKDGAYEPLKESEILIKN